MFLLFLVCLSVFFLLFAIPFVFVVKVGPEDADRISSLEVEHQQKSLRLISYWVVGYSIGMFLCILFFHYNKDNLSFVVINELPLYVGFLSKYFRISYISIVFSIIINFIFLIRINELSKRLPLLVSYFTFIYLIFANALAIISFFSSSIVIFFIFSQASLFFTIVSTNFYNKDIPNENDLYFYFIYSISLLLIVLGVFFVFILNRDYHLLLIGALWIQGGIFPFHNWCFSRISLLPLRSIFTLITFYGLRISNIIPYVLSYFPKELFIVFFVIVLCYFSFLNFTKSSGEIVKNIYNFYVHLAIFYLILIENKGEFFLFLLLNAEVIYHSFFLIKCCERKTDRDFFVINPIILLMIYIYIFPSLGFSILGLFPLLLYLWNINLGLVIILVMNVLLLAMFLIKNAVLLKKDYKISATREVFFLLSIFFINIFVGIWNVL